MFGPSMTKWFLAYSGCSDMLEVVASELESDGFYHVVVG